MLVSGILLSIGHIAKTLVKSYGLIVGIKRSCSRFGMNMFKEVYRTSILRSILIFLLMRVQLSLSDPISLQRLRMIRKSFLTITLLVTLLFQHETMLTTQYLRSEGWMRPGFYTLKM